MNPPTRPWGPPSTSTTGLMATNGTTLPTRRPPRRPRRLHLLSVAGAFALLPMPWGWLLPPVVVGASLLALPFAARGVATFARDERRFPTVSAMVVMAVAQLAAWTYATGLLW